MSESNNRLIQWTQQQRTGIRILVFVSLMIAVLILIFCVAAFLYYLNVNNLLRRESLAILPNIQVREFLRFDDEEAYPARVAVGADGTVYTGSYATGALWAVDSTGQAQELADSRAAIGSVIGLDLAPDGSLYILDRRDPLLDRGAIVWRYDGTTLEQITTLALTGTNAILKPNDLTLDGEGNLYVVDWGLERVLKLAPPAYQPEVWWVSPHSAEAQSAPTAIAYHATANSLLIGDLLLNKIYEVPVTSADTLADSRVLYEHRRTSDNPGFSGLTVAPDGTIYVAALDMNSVARLDTASNELIYLAGAFRGSSDLAYDALHQRLYVTNWDQRWLQPVSFIFIEFDVKPRLPFSLDVIEFAAQDE